MREIKEDASKIDSYSKVPYGAVLDTIAIRDKVARTVIMIQPAKKTVRSFNLARETKANAAAARAIKNPEDNTERLKSGLSGPKTLIEEFRAQRKTIGARKNSIPAENVNHLPFTPEVMPLTNAVTHPKIIKAKVTIKIIDTANRAETSTL